ncbi:hypothetical protein BPAE_0292g00040 [Botrytis paeoniae]|uniref:Uncharacterized protein n=1 Tax=Botrytis paeoniae TaxID=278948 RepID=A0A4Z1F853_9HELO|nr:hypothetical protein BPAE_0292g00040 [Botrytis paeoniae]
MPCSNNLEAGICEQSGTDTDVKSMVVAVISLTCQNPRHVSCRLLEGILSMFLGKILSWEFYQSSKYSAHPANEE